MRILLCFALAFFLFTANAVLSQQDSIVAVNSCYGDAQDLCFVDKHIKKQKPAPKKVVRAQAAPARSDGKFHARISAYTAAADETGSGNGITASGRPVTPGRTIACPRQYKFGTQIAIDGYGTYVCEDRGGAIHGTRFDIYVPTKAEAFAIGRRTVLARVIR